MKFEIDSETGEKTLVGIDISDLSNVREVKITDKEEEYVIYYRNKNQEINSYHMFGNLDEVDKFINEDLPKTEENFRLLGVYPTISSVPYEAVEINKYQRFEKWPE